MSKKKKKHKGKQMNRNEGSRKSVDKVMTNAFSNIGFGLSAFFGFDPIIGKKDPDLDEYVQKSLSGAVVGNVNTIPDLSTVPNQGEALYRRLSITLPFKKVIDMDATKDSSIKRTYVVLCRKKNAKNIITDSSKSYFIRSILMYSSLAPTYHGIKDKWEAQIDQNNESADVLMIPNVYVYGEHPMYINVMVVCVPDFKDETHYNDGKITENFQEYLTNVVSSVATASIKTGCDRLAIDPYDGVKVLEKNPYDVGEAYNTVFNNEPCTKMIPDVVFSIEDDTMYIIFSSALQ